MGSGIGLGAALLEDGVSDRQAEALAQMYLDAAPENAVSADEYVWAWARLTREDMERTGLKRGFDCHAKNIGLDPSKSDLERPVVVSVGDGERDPVAVWDGVHRIMSALALGSESLPAAVGYKKSMLRPSAARSGKPGAR